MPDTDPQVVLLDQTITSSQTADEPLTVKVVVTYEYQVTGTTADQAIIEVLQPR